MRRSVERLGASGVLLALLAASPAAAQYREYFVRGKVQGTGGEPLVDVQIELRDRSTSRLYHLKTDKDGTYKFAGLPHGVYAVSFRKNSYAPREDEWDLSASQSRMKRVEVPDVVLVSLAQVRKTQRIQEAGARNKGAAEKVRSRDFDGALALLQPALQENPDDADTLFLMGLAYAGKAMWAEASEALTRVTELSPAFPPAHFELGVCHRQLGDLPKALAAYDRNLELDPGNADAAYNSGLVLFETNRIDEARARFESGLASKPEDPELLEMAGRCDIHQGNLEAGRERLEKARAATTNPAKRAFLDALIDKLPAPAVR